jgi:hypothetical protein
MTSYAYSLDRQIWAGRYPSRKEAAEAAIARAIKETSPPETVYVAQRIEPDLRAYGHARAIIETMRRRVREDNGDVADGYLRGLGEDVIADLDGVVENAIVEWLNRSGLVPGWVRIEAVGEYPLPSAQARYSVSGTDREVRDLGVEDSGQR